MSVESYLLLVRSVTYAQRVQKVLSRTGVHSQIFRAPRTITELGCAYAVYVSAADVSAVLKVLREHALFPVKIFSVQQGTYREVNYDLF